MTFQNRPRDWQTLYPDCPIGLRITDLWQNDFFVKKTFGGAGGARLILRSQKAVFIVNGDNEVRIDSLRKASEHLGKMGIDASYKKISRYIKSGKAVDGYTFRWA